MKSWWFSISSVTPAASAFGAQRPRAFRAPSSTSSCQRWPGRGAIAAEDRRQRDADEIGAERLGVAEGSRSMSPCCRPEETIGTMSSPSSRRSSAARSASLIGFEPAVRAARSRLPPSSVGERDETLEADAVRIGARRAARPAGRDSR